MSMQAAAYGRLGQDPRSINTKSGKPMVTASIATSIGEQDDPPLWIGVVAFGRVAEDLERHSKGDLISVSGRVQMSRWTSSAGEKREQMQIVADSVVSSRTVRPSGGRPRADEERQDRRAQGSQRELDDEIPF